MKRNLILASIACFSSLNSLEIFLGGNLGGYPIQASPGIGILAAIMNKMDSLTTAELRYGVQVEAHYGAQEEFNGSSGEALKVNSNAFRADIGLPLLFGGRNHFAYAQFTFAFIRGSGNFSYRDTSFGTTEFGDFSTNLFGFGGDIGYSYMRDNFFIRIGLGYVWPRAISVAYVSSVDGQQKEITMEGKTCHLCGKIIIAGGVFF